MSRLDIFQGLFTSIAVHSHNFFASSTDTNTDVETLVDWCDTLLSSKGEASGVAWAQRILTGYGNFNEEQRLVFYRVLASRYQPNPISVESSSKAYTQDQNVGNLAQLILSVEPQRQELFRRLNLAPDGTATLVALREGLLQYISQAPALKSVDNDLKHLFGSWFNRGFLVLRRIDWNTPARLLEKIIHYEAVHEINGWDELRRRVNPDDRRCFAFFHPALGEDPLIFVEVALTVDTPSTINELLDEKRVPDATENASTAVFYSISNCQAGLRGVSFGNFLIKQVAHELALEIPSLKHFVTLSPMPGFVKWLESQVDQPLAATTSAALDIINQPNWFEDPVSNQAAQLLLMPLAAHYLLEVRRESWPLDPVAHFHIGNGSSLDRINWAADPSPLALRQSAGIMVNYLYDLDQIERNHEACVEKGLIAASRKVKNLALLLNVNIKEH